MQTHKHRARVKAVFYREEKMKKRWRGVAFLIFLFCLLALTSYLTNPFSRYSSVKTAFSTSLDADNQLILHQSGDIPVRSNFFYNGFSTAKSIYYIVTNVYEKNRGTQAKDLAGIIREIHEKRFNPDNLYLISGDHFNTLYIRSLGIFYSTILDPRTALDETDWVHRQQIYLQTTAYALDVFAQTPTLSTTIVPVGSRSVTLLNVYSPPSDTMFSLLYALRVMQTSIDLFTVYPFDQTVGGTYQTRTASQALVTYYMPTLQRQYNFYLASVVDPKTGLIRKDILLSGTKDIAKRQSAFYDNVILWKTEQLAQQLGVTPPDQNHLDELKAKILQTYWLPDKGYFLEDQSDAAIKNSYYSSDWLIVLETGFLTLQNPSEVQYYQRSVEFIQKNGIDQPFGLHYQMKDREEREYTLVKLFVPEYGGTAIWSHWGIEYVKALISLYKVTGKTEYLDTAQKQLDAYSANIVKYRCYPEVYSSNGKMLQNFFYKSVCETGWVVNYEEASKMLQSARMQ